MSVWVFMNTWTHGGVPGGGGRLMGAVWNFVWIVVSPRADKVTWLSLAPKFLTAHILVIV